MSKEPLRLSDAAWGPLLACGVLAGTVVNLLIGVAFRLVLMLVTVAISPPGPDSPAMYATWPLFGTFLARAASPMTLGFGALSGLAIALVLRLARAGRLATLAFAGLAFAFLGIAFSLPIPTHEFVYPERVLSYCLGLVGDCIRGSFLAWITAILYRWWTAR